MPANCDKGTKRVAGDFDTLVGRISAVSDALREETVASVNRAVTARAWITGFYIVEYEQHGRDRAAYGARLLKNLSERLDEASFSLSNLKNFKALYLSFPELGAPVVSYLSSFFGKGQTPSGLLPHHIDGLRAGKGQMSSGLLPAPGSQGMPDWLPGISADSVFMRLSLSHVIEFLRLSDPLQRSFYAYSAMRGTWSVRELRRQIESRYYERSGWSGNPEKLALLTDGRADRESARESLRSPHVFEFLGLASRDVWEESDLEQAAIDHLQSFLLEMGLGFCFESRQKKILIDGRYHKVDLVFYHRILKCHVLVELKARRFGYEDAAQLSLYLAYWRKHETQPDDNPPVGILLCTEAGAEMVEYVSTFVDPALFVSTYEVRLPDKEKVAAFLRRENAGSLSTISVNEKKEKNQ